MSVTVTQPAKSHSPLVYPDPVGATRLPRAATGHSPLLHRNENQALRVNQHPALFLAISSEDRRSLPGAAR